MEYVRPSKGAQDCKSFSLSQVMIRWFETIARAVMVLLPRHLSWVYMAVQVKKVATTFELLLATHRALEHFIPRPH